MLANGSKPTKNKTAADYLPCEFCLQFFNKNALTAHVKVCSSAPPDVQTQNCQKRGRALLAKYLKLPENDNISVENILETIKDTKDTQGIKSLCQNDFLIRCFVDSGLERLGPKNEQRIHDIGYIRNKVRLVGRLLAVLNRQREEPKDMNYYISGKSAFHTWDIDFV